MRTVQNLQAALETAFGKIVSWEELAPGVYDVGIRSCEEEFGLADNYFIVDVDSPVISAQAKTYGKLLEGAEGVFVYDVDDSDSGKFIIEYETGRYLYKMGKCSFEDASIRETALFGMEHHPEYFGMYPVPEVTPWGRTSRHRVIDNGVYMIETDTCDSVLSVCYPYWECELSDTAKQMGTHLESDIEEGIDSVMGNIFFLSDDACIPIFELMSDRPEWEKKHIIDPAALMNAIWQYHPEYAIAHNSTEQAGGHDTLGLLLNELGNNVELHGSVENMIVVSPSVGVDYFLSC